MECFIEIMFIIGVIIVLVDRLSNKNNSRSSTSTNSQARSDDAIGMDPYLAGLITMEMLDQAEWSLHSQEDDYDYPADDSPGEYEDDMDYDIDYDDDDYDDSDYE
jgi:hypothetical protein